MSETLKSLRNRFNYSQNSVAKYLGISRQMYIKYEKGEVEPPLKVIGNLSALYKVPFETIAMSFSEKSETDYKYKISTISEMVVEEPAMEESADQVYSRTIMGVFEKLDFAQQLKVFSELAGFIQKRSDEISGTLLKTKKEKDPLKEIWDRAAASKGVSKGWKWNREELYDREICKDGDK